MNRRPLRAALLSLALAGCAETVAARNAAPIRCAFASGRECPPGASCPSDDGCNTCTCTSDGLRCTERACVDAALVRDLPPAVDATDAAREGPGGACYADRDCAAGLRCVVLAGCAPLREGRCADIAGCERRPSATAYCDCDGRSFETISACPPIGSYLHAGPCEALDAGDDVTVDAGDDVTVDAGAARRYATASFLWVADGDGFGGPSITVTGDGVLHAHAFPGQPLDAEMRLGVAVTDELFARWERASLAGLPHPPDDRDSCTLTMNVRLCERCERVVVWFWRLDQVAPELDAVLDWFAAYAAATNPATICAR